MISMQEALNISRRSALEKQIREAAAAGEFKTTVFMDSEEAAELAVEVCFVHQFMVSNVEEINQGETIKYQFDVSWADYKPQTHIY